MRRIAPPVVSVFCTARNAAPMIEATIRSIMAQDFQNWEMIIVDDGSTDDTASIVRGLASSDPRIRLIATGGVGRGRALNLALTEAKANLVANIDADDESHPCRIRWQLDAMRRHPEFAIVATEYALVDGPASPAWPEIDPSAAFATKDVTRAVAISNPICHSSVMMRKGAMTGLGGYNENLLIEDYDLWVRCAAAGLRLGEIQLPLTARLVEDPAAFGRMGRTARGAGRGCVHVGALRRQIRRAAGPPRNPRLVTFAGPGTPPGSDRSAEIKCEVPGFHISRLLS
jgi:teichuronic acid biosynthesis glycosyltransferase TuaG